MAWLSRRPLLLRLPPIHPSGQLVVAHDSSSHRKSWAKHGTRGVYLSPATSHYRCFNVFIPLSASYRVCETLAHFPDPLFEEPVNSPHYPDPTLSEPVPPSTSPPPLTEIPPYPIPIPPSHPPPPLTTLPAPTTVAVGTAGVPLALSPPTRPSPVSFLTLRSSPPLPRRSPTALARPS